MFPYLGSRERDMSKSVVKYEYEGEGEWIVSSAEIF